jgi:dehydrogenase/reductase SDR family protein 1
MFENGESTEFSGMCVRALAVDPQRLTKTGRVLMTGDLAYEYGLQDVDGMNSTLLDHDKPCVVQVV